MASIDRRPELRNPFELRAIGMRFLNVSRQEELKKRCQSVIAKSQT